VALAGSPFDAVPGIRRGRQAVGLIPSPCQSGFCAGAREHDRACLDMSLDTHQSVYHEQLLEHLLIEKCDKPRTSSAGKDSAGCEATLYSRLYA
jgi:hypothetical protein